MRKKREERRFLWWFIAKKLSPERPFRNFKEEFKRKYEK